jgi:hypothetical protein
MQNLQCICADMSKRSVDLYLKYRWIEESFAHLNYEVDCTEKKTNAILKQGSKNQRSDLHRIAVVRYHYFKMMQYVHEIFGILQDPRTFYCRWQRVKELQPPLQLPGLHFSGEK